MKKQIFLLFAVLTYSNLALSAENYSNHSYDRFGFTQVPTVTVGGRIEVSGAQSSQDEYYSGDTINLMNIEGTSPITMNNQATDDLKFATEASLLFKINGLNDYGFKYGAVFELNVNSSENSWKNDDNSTKSYIYGESLFGKFEFGSEVGVSKKMKVDASTYARAAGGIKGKYLNYINLPSGTDVYSPLFILVPELPTSHGGYAIGFSNMFFLCDLNGDGTLAGASELECSYDRAYENFELNFQRMENASKISYYTPEILGLQFGISYTPDTGDKIINDGRFNQRLMGGDLEDVLEYGATFKQTFSGVDLVLSATGETGKYKVGNTLITADVRDDLKAYQFGASVTYFGLTLVGSYGNWQNSLNYKLNSDGVTKPIDNDGVYQTLGLAYEFGPVNASGTYFTSEFQKNKYTAYSVGVDFKVARGFMPYIEYTNFKFEADEAKFASVTNNEGSVILAGILFNF